MWLSVLLTVSLFYQDSYSQSVDEKKDEISRFHKTALLSYNKTKLQAEKNAKLKYLENLQNEIEDFYLLAEKMEELGEYEKAKNCYERILTLIEQDAGLKPYISKRNKNIKKLAAKSRKLVSKKIQQAKKKQRAELS